MPETMPSNHTVLQLQTDLLNAVLTNQALPGQTRPIQLADLGFVLRQPEIFLLDNHLAGTILIAAPPKPLRVVSPPALAEHARECGDTAFFQFQPPQLAPDEIGLTLEIRIATPVPNQAMLGLSGLHVRFSKTGTEWLAADGIYSAA